MAYQYKPQKQAKTILEFDARLRKQFPGAVKTSAYKQGVKPGSRKITKMSKTKTKFRTPFLTKYPAFKKFIKE